MRVLYLEGDGTAVRYLSGTFRKMGVDHQLVLPGEALPHSLSEFQAVVISDFPRLLLQEAEPLLVQAITQSGLGLLMVGGPHSFGRGGYAESALAALLPIDLQAGDDRACSASGVLLEVKLPHHPLLRGLQFREPLTAIGHNRFRRRRSSSELLSARALMRGGPAGFSLSRDSAPMLVVRESIDGATGRTAALATSLAPPWSGGLTEWGARRLSIDSQTDVGEGYAMFVLNLIRWLCGEEVLFRGNEDWKDLPEELLSETPPVVRATRQAQAGPSIGLTLPLHPLHPPP